MLNFLVHFHNHLLIFAFGISQHKYLLDLHIVLVSRMIMMITCSPGLIIVVVVFLGIHDF